MTKRHVLPLLVFVAMFVRLGGSQECLAALIVGHTQVTAVDVGGFPGTSLQFSGSTSYNNLTFHWYQHAAGSVAATPTAVGNVYLLGQQYAGTPSNLSSSTPGYIATGVDVGTVYQFSASVTVNPNTQYFIYSDASMQTVYENPGTYGDGQSWGALFSGSSFVHQASQDRAFSLQGAAAAIPEPTTLAALAGLLAMGLIGRWWRSG